MPATSLKHFNTVKDSKNEDALIAQEARHKRRKNDDDDDDGSFGGGAASGENMYEYEIGADALPAASSGGQRELLSTPTSVPLPAPTEVPIPAPTSVPAPTAERCNTFVMTDSWGDGWDNATYKVVDEDGGVMYKGTMASGTSYRLVVGECTATRTTPDDFQRLRACLLASPARIWTL